MCVSVPRVQCPQRAQAGTHSLELELGTTISCFVGVGTQTQVFYKTSSSLSHHWVISLASHPHS